MITSMVVARVRAKGQGLCACIDVWLVSTLSPLQTHPDYKDLVAAIDLVHRGGCGGFIYHNSDTLTMQVDHLPIPQQVHKSAMRNNDTLREIEAARMYLEEMQVRARVAFL